MKKMHRATVAVAFVILGMIPMRSQALPLGFDMEILLLLAGPVSEAVQETILLVRRGDNFISKDSLSIGCIAGASAGFMVGVAPILGFVDTAVGAPVGASYIVGTTMLSCAMAMVSSAAGMGTVWGLRRWREWRDTPPPPPPPTPKPAPVKSQTPLNLDNQGRANPSHVSYRLPWSLPPVPR